MTVSAPQSSAALSQELLDRYASLYPFAAEDSTIAWYLRMFLQSFTLPLRLPIALYGSMGKYACSLVNLTTLMLQLSFLRWLGFFANPDLFASLRLELFIWATLILAVANCAETLFRDWRTDGIESLCPGLVRLYLFEWFLPKRWCNDVTIYRWVLPALGVGMGWLLRGSDPALATYLILAGITLWIESNYVYLIERWKLVRQRDLKSIQKQRVQTLTGAAQQQRDDVTGIVSLALPNASTSPNTSYTDGLPESLAKIIQPVTGEHSRPALMACPHCEQLLKGGSEYLGKKIKCSRCKKRFFCRKVNLR